jgi:hypothetical protein
LKPNSEKRFLSKSSVIYLISVLIASGILGSLISGLNNPWLGWLVGAVIILTGIGAELKSYLEDKNKPYHVSISLGSLLNDYPILNEKLHSPIELFIDNKIASVLEEIFQEKNKAGELFFNPEHIPSGLVWVIKDADIYNYAKLATYFDKAALKSSQGYVYSTNISLPSELSETGNHYIKEHLNITNLLIEKEVEHVYPVSGSFKKVKMPRLLRIQLLCENPSPDRMIKLIKQFEADISDGSKGINENSCLFFQKNNTFILNVDNKNLTNSLGLSTTFEKSAVCLGDYIIYSDTVVLKWDIPSNVLYLMFGKEIVDNYKLLFLLFWEDWKGKNPDISDAYINKFLSSTESVPQISATTESIVK